MVMTRGRVVKSPSGEVSPSSLYMVSLIESLIGEYRLKKTNFQALAKCTGQIRCRAGRARSHPGRVHTARLRERGIRAGLSVSGAGQDVAIRRSLEVRRDGERVFDSVQATWNLLERGAESALQDAHGAGMKVVVKESLANGRLSHENRDQADLLFPAVARIRELAKSRGLTVETLALAAALARPWADVVLTGAATVGQIQSNVAALELAYDAELEEQLGSVSINSTEYWRARSSFRWN